MTEYKQYRSFADKHEQPLKQALGMYIACNLITAANQYDDMKHGIDYKWPQGKVWARIRSNSAMPYRHEITIRSHTQTDTNKTEYQKLIDGDIDATIGVYGILDRQGEGLAYCRIIDMQALANRLRELQDEPINKYGAAINNTDHSQLIALRMSEFPNVTLWEFGGD